MSINKFTTYSFLGISSCVIILTFVSVIGKVEAYFHTGAEDKTTISNFTGYLENDLPQINWIESNGDVIGNEYLKSEIAKHYLQSWKFLNLSLYNHNFYLLEDYFDIKLIEQIETNYASNAGEIEQIDLEHNLVLKHVSDDYSVAVIEDNNVKVKVRTILPNGLIYNKEKRYNLNVKMVLQDGNWKIFNWASTIVESNDKQSSSEEKSIAEKLIIIDNIKGINYYPSTTPWLTFWENYTPETIQKDFEEVKNLGLNAVRIFIPVENFGRNKINKNSIRKLDNLLSIAKEKELFVIPTLFDFPIGFELSNYPTYYRQLKYILERYKDNETIVAWNLKNEPDKDFEIHGKERVMEWLAFIIKYSRSFDNNHPITVGWANPDNAHLLANKLDYISLHHYRELKDLISSIDALKKLNKKIVIEEFGFSSASSIWNMYSHDEDRQNILTSEVLQFMKKNDLPWLLWTLYDFVEAPESVFGKRPWIQNDQKGYGLISTEGKIKKLGNNITTYTNYKQTN